MNYIKMLLIPGCLIVLAVCNNAIAELRTIEFTGHVEYVYSAPSTNNTSAGDVITGKVVYNTDMASSMWGTDTYQIYEEINGTSYIEFTLNGKTYRSAPTNSCISAHIMNDFMDNFTIDSHCDIEVDAMQWNGFMMFHLWGSADALNSTALSQPFPALEKWEQTSFYFGANGPFDGFQAKITGYEIASSESPVEITPASGRILETQLWANGFTLGAIVSGVTQPLTPADVNFTVNGWTISQSSCQYTDGLMLSRNVWGFHCGGQQYALRRGVNTANVSVTLPDGRVVDQTTTWEVISVQP